MTITSTCDKKRNSHSQIILDVPVITNVYMLNDFKLIVLNTVTVCLVKRVCVIIDKHNVMVAGPSGAHGTDVTSLAVPGRVITCARAPTLYRGLVYLAREIIVRQACAH
ncbi:hypothetical protein MAR_033759 [Mya arenaria]|uniref:Uncharacterized protein n=1 Tax=Mya arenaria TaxID=6604 RepID=A0ABY7GBB1_MYAAR|nr:hypothetical protein MAR_033759 [Mya arenaria]